MKTRKKELAQNLQNKGYKLNKANIKMLLDFIKRAEKERCAEVQYIYFDYNKEGAADVCAAFGNYAILNYYEKLPLEKETDPKQFLTNTIKADAQRYYESVSINGYTIGEIKTNKPQTLQEFADEKTAQGLRVDFIAYNKDNYYTFRSFIMKNHTANPSAVDGLAIDNSYNKKTANEARKNAQRIYYIISCSDYFKRIADKREQRNKNKVHQLSYNNYINFAVDRLTDAQVKDNYSICTTGAPCYTTTAHALGGYKFGIDENPLDGSGYFMPFFKEKLARRLAAYKSEQAQKRYNEINKNIFIEEIEEIRSTSRAACLSLFAAFDDIYYKSAFDDGVKELSSIMCECDRFVKKIDQFRSIEHFKENLKALKERAAKSLFFYNGDRIKKYKYACIHQYIKVGDHYETAPEVRADHYWGDAEKYSQVIY